VASSLIMLLDRFQRVASKGLLHACGDRGSCDGASLMPARAARLTPGSAEFVGLNAGGRLTVRLVRALARRLPHRWNVECCPPIRRAS
jgi:hypothetical protein